MAALARFGPPVALMAIIFFLSAQPQLGPDLGGFDLLLRKLAHMIGYGMLFLLWRRALPDAPPTAAAAIAVSYAITDEIHQSFVEGRHGTPVDVVIDSAGVALAWLASLRLPVRRTG